MGAEISWAETRLNVLRDFNLAGSNGASRWPRFVQLSQLAGFNELDFARINASKSIVRQWANNAGHPPEDKREHFKRIIVGVLSERLYGRNPALQNS